MIYNSVSFKFILESLRFHGQSVCVRTVHGILECVVMRYVYDFRFFIPCVIVFFFVLFGYYRLICVHNR